RTITIPNTTGATDTICLETLGNCAGSGGSGGVDTTGSPALNQLAYFSDADTLQGSSNLAFDGSALALTGTFTTSGLTTLNGGLTLQTGDTFTINGDALTDLTGNGLQTATNTLTLALEADKGLEVDANGLSLIDCTTNQILKYNASGQW